MNKRYIYGSLLLWLVTVLTVSVSSFLYYRLECAEVVSTYKLDELSQVKKAVGAFSTLLDEEIDNAVFFTQAAGVKELYDGNESGVSVVMQNLVSYMQSHPSAVQLRYLDKSGKEIFRVNRVSGKPHIVPKEQLQDKSSRYYFSKSVNLQKDGVYLSPIDLNIENHLVEKPYNPVLRICVPVYLDDNSSSGSFVINYSMGSLLKTIKENGLYLITEDGDVLAGPNSSGEWAYYIKNDKLGYRLDIFEDLQKKETFCGNRENIITYASVSESNDKILHENHDTLAEESWFVASVLNNFRKDSGLDLYKRQLLLGNLVFALVLYLLIYFVSRYVYLVTLKERELRDALDSIAKSSPGILFQWYENDDGSRGFSYISDQAEDVFGYDTKDIIKDYRILGLSESDILRLDDVLNEAKQTLGNIEYECTLLLRDGSKKTFRVVSCIKPSKKGYLFSGIIIDLTETIEHEKELVRAYEDKKTLSNQLMESNIILSQKAVELQRLNEEKSDFICIATHDLKNPLSAILSILDLLKDHVSDQDTEVVEYLEMIENSSAHMLDIVNGIVNIQKLETGNLELDLDKADVSSLVRKAVNNVKVLADAKKIHLNLNLAEKLIATVDPLKIYESIDNYLSNAVKYSPEGGNVYVKLERIDAETHDILHFSVKDEGQGLTEKDKQLVFRKFQKLSARPTGGENSTGLGLSIVKRLIEAHNGQVGLESEYGQGATFFFNLFIEKN